MTDNATDELIEDYMHALDKLSTVRAYGTSEDILPALEQVCKTSEPLVTHLLFRLANLLIAYGNKLKE
jgi:hypothetical protein